MFKHRKKGVVVENLCEVSVLLSDAAMVLQYDLSGLDDAREIGYVADLLARVCEIIEDIDDRN